MKMLVTRKTATLLLFACGIATLLGASQLGLSPFALANAEDETPGTKLLEEEGDEVEASVLQRPIPPFGDAKAPTVTDWAKHSNVFDLKPRSDAETRAEVALSGPLTDIGFHFVEVPLSEVAEYIRETLTVEVQLDEAALREIGLATDSPVSAKIRGVRLDSALSLVLAPLDLTYVVSNEVILITSKEKAETIVDARVYPVDLILEQDAETIARLIRTTIASDTWVENGGEGGTISILSGRLVITQTYHVHRQITDLLCQLRTAKEKEAALEQEKKVPEESGSRYR